MLGSTIHTTHGLCTITILLANVVAPPLHAALISSSVNVCSTLMHFFFQPPTMVYFISCHKGLSLCSLLSNQQCTQKSHAQPCTFHSHCMYLVEGMVGELCNYYFPHGGRTSLFRHWWEETRHHNFHTSVQLLHSLSLSLFNPPLVVFNAI